MVLIWPQFWIFYENPELNPLLIIVVLFTFIAFIVRMNARPSASSIIHYDTLPRAATSVALLNNPFSVKIISESSFDLEQLSNGLRLCVKTEFSFWLTTYWIVNVNDLHKALCSSWDEIRKNIFDSTFLVDQYYDQNELELVDVKGESTEITVKPTKAITEATLGDPPRSVYPLVAVLIRNEDIDNLGNEDSAVMALFCIIHIRDSVCKLETSIISQLVKQKNGNTINLQTLYTPEENVTQQPLCTICQDELISRVLLPCRHACVCGVCYDKLDKCPLCRGYIQSFFTIREETQEEANDEQVNVETQRLSILQRMNNKLNSWFGYN